MIESLLKRDPSGTWTIPYSSITEEIESCAITWSEKCNDLFKQIPIHPLTDFHRSLTNLRCRLILINQRRNQTVNEEVNRLALAKLIVKVAVAANQLTSQNINPTLFKEEDRDYLDALLKEQTEGIGKSLRLGKDDLANEFTIQPLHKAARNGQKEQVELLLNQGARVDARDNYCRQPLQLAAMNGNMEIIELLLERGAAVDTADINGVSPLHAAAENGNLEIAELLLNKGAKVDAATNDGMQPLHAAARDGHKEIAELLLSRGAPVSPILGDDCRPLHWATINRHKEIVKLLLRRGASVDVADKFGLQPLHLASMNGDIKIMELLLSRGAAVDALDQEGKGPRAHAARSNRKEIENLLLTYLKLRPLLKVYRNQGQLTRFINKDPFPIEKSYINLAIVERESYKDVERGIQKLSRYQSASSFFDQTPSIELSHLFDSNSRVYVEGEAGSGKSTLCHYLAQVWATLSPEERFETLGPWANRYEAVVRIRLREISTLPKRAKLSDLIKKLYPGLLITSIDRNKTLYILDSFDEIAPLEEVCKRSREDERWKIVSDLIEEPNWLITSRPGLFSSRFPICRQLKNLGFTENNIKSYIQRFGSDFKFPSEDLEKAVINNEDLKALAHVPLYLELICTLWKDYQSDLSILNNPVALYNEIVTYLFRRHLERLYKGTISVLKSRVMNHDDVQLYRECLEKIAFMSRQSNSNKITPSVYETVFEQEPFKNYDDKVLNDFGKCLFEEMGLLTRRGDAKQLFDQEYAFIHPTFEEYFAARHVVAALESSNLLVNGETAGEWLERNHLLKEKEMIIDFIASLVSGSKHLNVLAERLVENHPTHVNENSWNCPLHRAVSLGLISLSEVLINRGAKIDETNSSNSQPLHVAAYNGHKKIVEFLLKKEAKVDFAMNNGWQPIHLAVLRGHKEVVELLLNYGAKANVVNNNGTEPIHYAALNGYKAIVELLLTHGGNVNAAKNDGRKPIHMAALNGHKEVVQMLLNNGAEDNPADNDGYKPFHLAARNGHKEVVLLLVGGDTAKANSIMKYPGIRPRMREVDPKQLKSFISKRFDSADAAARILLGGYF